MAESFEQAKQRAEPFTLIGGDRMRILWDTVQHCASLPGDMVEVGVYRGGSAMLIHAASPEQHLYLFDTFKGHPRLAHSDEASHHPGRFDDTSEEAVRALFESSALPPVLIAGDFPESLSRFLCRNLAFIHCDVDLYESTKAVLEYLWPRLVEGGALVCDDYGFDDCPGAMRAVDEFALGRPDVRLERLPTLQARLWRVAA